MNALSTIHGKFCGARRKLAEAIGYGGFSYMAAHDMDRKIERHLDIDDGFFIETGAFDGRAQSNTYYFEKVRHWSGILIEPNPDLCQECRRRRKRSQVIQTALVAADYESDTIQLTLNGLTSKTASDPERAGTEQITVPASTITKVLDRFDLSREIDLFSLDVEGYEPQVLRGLDLNKYFPRYFCIEVHDRDRVEAILGLRYRAVELLYDAGPYQDVLFARK